MNSAKTPRCKLDKTTYENLCKLLKDQSKRDVFLKELGQIPDALQMLTPGGSNFFVNIVILYDRVSWIEDHLIADTSLLMMASPEDPDCKAGIHHLGIANQLGDIRLIIESNPSLMEVQTRRGKTALDLCSNAKMKGLFTDILTRSKTQPPTPALAE